MAAKTRTYSSNRRAAQAAQTRADVVAAAVDCFRANGWAGTTMNAVAEKAGVSVETVYAGFKNKKALLRAATDYSIVGDAEPVAFIDRPEVAAFSHGSTAERLRAGMSMLGAVHSRSAQMVQAMTDAAQTDADAKEWRAQGEANRRVDISHSLAMVFDQPIDEETLDVTWALYGPELFLKFTVELGWSLERYEEEMFELTWSIAERRGLIPKAARRSRS